MSMTENTNIDVTTSDNLDDFAAEFFGGNQQPSDNAKSEVEETIVEEANDAPEETNTHSAENDGATEEDNSEEKPENETDDDGKPKKVNRFQERINEITAERRAAERRAEEAERREQELLRKLEEKEAKAASTTKEEDGESTLSGGPDPEAVDEKGNLKYPLGVYDPQYIKDTMQYVLDQERAAREKAEKQALEASKQDAYRADLQSSWNEKLVDVQERYPDFREKGEQMLSVFEGIDEAYGQYLTDTLMEMDAGPEVFYYLANNLDEAQAIVNAGPRKATMALTKLEVQLAGNKTQGTAPKTTKAPTPPPRVKGSAVAQPSVSLDTDDLDAFSRALFKK